MFPANKPLENNAAILTTIRGRDRARVRVRVRGRGRGSQG